MWQNANKWGLGANLIGQGLGFAGQYLQGKANEKTMAEAQAAEDQYNMAVQAWQDEQARAAHGRAMAEWEAARARELAILKDQGATQDELYAHDQDLARQFMEQVARFGPEEAQAQIDENTAAAIAEQGEAIEGARAERPEVAAHMSDAFQKAAADAMAKQDAVADNYSTGLAGLTGVTRLRPKENLAAMTIGTIGNKGDRIRDYIEKMGQLRQRRLGYNPPSPPSGPGSDAGRPVEPDMEFTTPNTGNWVSAIGSLLSSGANIFGNWNQLNNQRNKWGG